MPLMMSEQDPATAMLCKDNVFSVSSETSFGDLRVQCSFYPVENLKYSLAGR